MRKIYILFILLITTLIVSAQQPDYNPYSPVDMSTKDWRLAVHSFYNNHNNSNYLTNEFSFAINDSKYIDEELKNRQMNKIKGDVTAGRSSLAGFGIWLNSQKKENNIFYYLGLDSQQILDGILDPDLIGLALYGNKHYAGQNLTISKSEYTNIYFNRIKAGIGKTIGNNDYKHTLSAVVGFTIGQNFNYLNIAEAQLYTQTDGDYLDIDIQAETQMADTSWANVFTINGMGASVDLHYSLYKEQDFFIAVNLHNLGFIQWNKNPYTASIDTSFHFEGSTNQQVPDDFSKDKLRKLIFPNASTSSFTKSLDFDIQFTAGKYFQNGEFYVGINTTFYPSLISSYRAELFATWNIKNRLSLTPIFAYSSFNKVNIGLAMGVKIWKSISLRAGSSYFNSAFNSQSPVGQGGFVSIVFIPSP